MSCFSGESHLCPSISKISPDPERVNALYAPFRPRELNPESYDNKMKFWTKAIEEWVDFGNRCTFTLKQLQKGLMISTINNSGNKTPACLEDVVKNLCTNREKSVLTVKEFYDDLKASESWTSWSQINTKRLISRLVPLPTFFYRGSNEEVKYVHVSYLKSLVDNLTKVDNLKNRLLSLTSFKELISSQTKISYPEDLALLMDYLKINKLIELDHVGTEDVVLFGDNLKISDVDKGKYDVKRSIEIHEQRRDEIYAKMEEAIKNAKIALKQERRSTAKHELKKKKMLGVRVDKINTALDSLMVISLRLEEAESDAKILQAYQSGKQALSNILKTNKLTVDSVSEAMLDVQEVLEEHAEINAGISRPLDDQDDLEELDAELEAMLLEDAAAEREKEHKETLRRQQEEDDTIKRLAGLKVVGDDLDVSFPKEEEDEHNKVPSPSSQ